MTRMQANPTELMAAVLAPAEEDWNEAGMEAAVCLLSSLWLRSH